MDTRSSLLGRGPFVTDGGLETDLIFHRGMDLPAFAAFPLVEEEPGRAALRAYYDEYAEIARRAGVGLVLESPTWRANPDWGTSLGYDADDLDRVNRDSIELLRELRDEYAVPNTLISGTIGPRGDGYVAGEAMEPDEAARYHSAQVASFAAAGADVASAYTLTGPEEAIGVVRAAREVGLPVAISFTVETDGRLPDGTPLARAIERVDEDDGGPDWYLVNCAHPRHIEPGLTPGGRWRERIAGILPNASTLTHAELDAAEELDEGDPAELAASCDRLRPLLPSLTIVGGCCGTDARHVAALWGLPETV
jgi:S-methylmethionine-dependent homocysteine/selenocysteine methylase